MAGARGRSKGRGDALLSVMLVDDHPLWRSTLRQALESRGLAHVVAEACDGAEAIEKALASAPDVIVMDMALPGSDGAVATRRILDQQPQTKVLVLSSSEERADVIRAVQAGARGYLLKTAGAREIAEAVRRVHSGEVVLPKGLGDVVLAEFRRMSGADEPAAITAVLASESEIDREGLERALEKSGIVVAATTGDPAALKAAVKDKAPSVVVIATGSAAWLEAAASLIEAEPHAGVLVLSRRIESSDAFSLLGPGRGGVGYLLRERVLAASDLADAVRRVAAGENALDPDVVAALVRGRGEKSPVDDLTPRERDVLALMAEGRSNAAISEQLFLSPKTLERYIGTIFMKLGLEETPDDHRRVLAVVTYLRASV